MYYYLAKGKTTIYFPQNCMISVTLVLSVCPSVPLLFNYYCYCEYYQLEKGEKRDEQFSGKSNSYIKKKG
jgi:hypothetical protein